MVPKSSLDPDRGGLSLGLPHFYSCSLMSRSCTRGTWINSYRQPSSIRSATA